MTDPMVPYSVEFPEYLEGYELETEAKGYLVGVRVTAASAVYDLTIYDPVRLSQEVVEVVDSTGYFVTGNLLVVPKVTRDAALRAVRQLARSGFNGLVPA